MNPSRRNRHGRRPRRENPAARVCNSARHWHTAKDEFDREAALARDFPDVLTVEALAMRTGITGQQAQDLIDRPGDDRAAIEEAVVGNPFVANWHPTPPKQFHESVSGFTGKSA